jgi:hypothetical protein
MFIKHVGKQGDRRVAIVFREVPGEDHMCLVVYPDVLPTHLHDSLMKAIESPEAQQAEQLADAIHRTLFPDGRPILTALHAEGMLKKVQTETIVVTPTPNASVKLSELNAILRQMKEGKQAVQKLAELDANAGITGKATRKDDFGRELRPPPQARNNLAGSTVPGVGMGALDDGAIADNLRQQAAKMEAEAKGLLAESARLQKEAASLSGAVPETTAAKKRGRPSKQAVADAAQG